MKHLTLTLGVAAAALFALPTTVSAQDAPAGTPPPRADGAGAGRGAGRMNPADRLKRMTESLGLTQDQQDKIKAIWEKNAPAMKELMSKGFQNMTDDDKAKMRDLMKAERDAVDAVLTQEQKDKMKAEMEKRGAGRRGGPGAPKPAAPAPDTTK